MKKTLKLLLLILLSVVFYSCNDELNSFSCEEPRVNDKKDVSDYALKKEFSTALSKAFTQSQVLEV